MASCEYGTTVEQGKKDSFFRPLIENVKGLSPWIGAGIIGIAGAETVGYFLISVVNFEEPMKTAFFGSVGMGGLCLGLRILERHKIKSIDKFYAESTSRAIDFYRKMYT